MYIRSLYFVPSNQSVTIPGAMAFFLKIWKNVNFCSTFRYFLSSDNFIPKWPLTPPFPTNGWVSSHNTQYTAPTHHTRHSTCLYYYLRVSNVSFPTNDFLHVSKLVRVATAFDIRRRSEGGGDPPKKNGKTTFSMHTGAAPGSEKMWTI